VGNGNGRDESERVLPAPELLWRFLETDGWHPQRLESPSLFRAGFIGENGQYTCYAQALVDPELFAFYVISPFKVPPDLRPAAAEFLTRVNYGMRVGNFEMDYSDGEVRYKSALLFDGVPLNETLIRNTIYPAVRTMDRYQPGLMRLVYGGATPEQACAEIEGGKRG